MGGPTAWLVGTGGPPKSRVSLSESAIPTAGHDPGWTLTTFSATEISKSRYPSGHSAVMSARSIRVLPEQKGFSPAKCHPSAARRAVVPSAPGRAAQTPYVAPGDGTRPASARMANASTWPSASRASERSCAAQLASAAKRAAVPPEPGFGSSVPHSAAISLNSIQGVKLLPLHSVVQTRIADSRFNRRGAIGNWRKSVSRTTRRGVRFPAERDHQSPRRLVSCLSG